MSKYSTTPTPSKRLSKPTRARIGEEAKSSTIPKYTNRALILINNRKKATIAITYNVKKLFLNRRLI